MKKLAVFLLIIALSACESKQNADSRIMIEQHTRRLNVLMHDIVNSRSEEGNQTRLTMNNFYSRYISRSQVFTSELAFQNITDKYKPHRATLLDINSSLQEYIQYRREAVSGLSGATSAYNAYKRYNDSYHEYTAKRSSSSYSYSFYSDMILNAAHDRLEELLKFFENRSNYYASLFLMDSISTLIDSLSSQYNHSITKSKLNEQLIVPPQLFDTINDWVTKNRSFLINLSLPD